jgi:hypothetical protein
MSTGGFYIEEKGLQELVRGLEATDRGLKDLKKIYGEMGRHAGLYVKGHEPVYGGPTKGRQVTIHLQDHTKGGGGKNAWASVSGVPYLIVQEFGGTSFWHKGGAGSLRKLNRGHRSFAAQGAKGHPIYKKPRNPKGYFIWNVWWRLRSYTGEKLTSGIQDISEKNGLHMEITDSGLGMEQNSWNGAA